MAPDLDDRVRDLEAAVMRLQGLEPRLLRLEAPAMTPEEAARFLRISRRTLFDHIDPESDRFDPDLAKCSYQQGPRFRRFDRSKLEAYRATRESHACIKTVPKAGRADVLRENSGQAAGGEAA